MLAVVMSVVVVAEVEESINGVGSEWRQGRRRWRSDVKEEAF
jgi:hypothetical protein